MNALFVGLGGAVGAVGRYGLSLLPFRGDFPLLTLVTNLLGAILIGFVAGLAGREKLSSGWTLKASPCSSGAGPDWPWPIWH